MKYCTSEDYDKLYAIYLKHGPESLIELAGNLQNKEILDLCCGRGRLSSEVLKQYPKKITMVDGDHEMLRGMDTKLSAYIDTVSIKIGDIPNVFVTLPIDSYDVIFCQQAINYWLDPGTAVDVHDLLKPNGLFIFNTFNKPPSRDLPAKQYVIDGVGFLEVNWLVGKTIYHMQCREGMIPHVNSFKWISPMEYCQILVPYFNVEEIKKGSTSLYRCRRK